MSRILELATADVRFPTSSTLDGSDAMNPDPDYSAAYLADPHRRPDAPDGPRLRVHHRPRQRRRGRRRSTRSPSTWSGATSRRCSPTWARSGGELVHDSQLRWLGPEKGVMHMAIGAVVNALWDLKAKRAGKPLWLLLAAMTPGGARRPGRLPLPHRRPDAGARRWRSSGRAAAGRDDAPSGGCSRTAIPAYTTTPGWLGYDDEKLARLCREAVADGFDADQAQGRRQPRRRRPPAAGSPARRSAPDIRIAIDANQRWDVDAGDRLDDALAPFDLAWIEEPTSPDDVLGHAAIARGGRPGARRDRRAHGQPGDVQAAAAGRTRCRSCRSTRRASAGVNENIANLLLAAKFGVPVCPHAGGVGLCEAVQHLSMFDFVAVSGHDGGRLIEYVDHLHEHFVDAGRRARRPLLAADGPGRRHRDARRFDRAAILHGWCPGEREPLDFGPPGIRRRQRRQPLPAVDDEAAPATARRGLGCAASATSTPRRTTASGCPSAGSARSCATKPREEFVALDEGRTPAAAGPGAAAGRRDDERFGCPPTTRRVWDFAAPASAAASRSRCSGSGSTASTSSTCTTRNATTSQAALTRASRRWCGCARRGWSAPSGSARCRPTALLAARDSATSDLLMIAGRYTLAEPSALAELIPAVPETRHVRGRTPRSSTPACWPRGEPAAGARYDYGPVPADMLARVPAIAARVREFGVELPTAALQYTRGRSPCARSSSAASTPDADPAERRADARGGARELWAVLAGRGLIPA